jgi:hypothetical protein
VEIPGALITFFRSALIMKCLVNQYQKWSIENGKR